MSTPRKRWPPTPDGRRYDFRRPLRAEFPLLAASMSLHYPDSAATSQIHRTALDAMVHRETQCRPNVMRSTYTPAEAATDVGARLKVSSGAR